MGSGGGRGKEVTTRVLPQGAERGVAAGLMAATMVQGESCRVSSAAALSQSDGLDLRGGADDEEFILAPFSPHHGC